MKLPSVIAAVILSFSTMGSTAGAADFVDVPDTNRFYENIDALSDLNIISGYPDGTFQPKAEVTRGQAAILIGRALGLDGTKRATSFSDVNAANTASGYIESAAAAGIISGFPDGTYRPNEPVTRGQTAILMGRAFDVTEAVDIHFPDVSPRSAAYPFVENMIAAGIASGYSNGLYRPFVAVPREQFAAFLHRAYTYEPGTEEVDWTDYFLANGQTASFLGEGNEFASYTTHTVWHDSRHVTVYEDNSGTVMARTFRLEDHQVVVIREEGEQYEDFEPAPGELDALAPLHIYLKEPLEEGASFEGWTIIDDEAILISPLRAFNQVIVLERMENGAVIRSYFAERYGEVKRELLMDDFMVTSEIESVH
ncbi:S-layer homology domain-containing protein [Domibacillus enclensis]|nr:S-layer homology domain-containing protein [Domibacillus enclensis]SIR09621.1 S-layer homology domain-containing protein [Domibacillus enclensis]